MTPYVQERLREIKSRLSLPAMSAPLFLVTSPELCIESCKAGIIGAFPTLNARTLDIADTWLKQIADALADAEADHPGKVGPWAANLIVHPSNSRVPEELKLVEKYKPPIVIIAWGKPSSVAGPIHDYGGLVFSDVATIEHARKAVDNGADGLVLVTAGAGGHTSDVSAFAFVPAVREFFDGPIIMGGGIVDGRGIRAAQVLGADFANLGTRFIGTTESFASDAYKQMLVDCTTRDVVKSPYFTGVHANYLMPSILAAGVDPAVLRDAAPIDVDKSNQKAWKDIWSGGHGVFATRRIMPTAELVRELIAEYGAVGV